MSTTVTVVHSPACHFCDDARAALAELASEFPVVVDLIAADSAPGRDIVRRHRAPMFPVVLVDGTFFSFGRLPRKKLRRLLEARTEATVA